jgi:hypothetical protein
MDDETKNSLREIIGYLYADEERHWTELGKPEDGHIFHDISRVSGWLDTAAQEQNHASYTQHPTIAPDGFARRA